MGDDRPTRYVERLEDGSEQVVYRASGFGGCVREVAAHGQGYTPAGTPDWLQVKFDEGTELEDPILQALAKRIDVEKLTGRAQEVVELDVGRVNGRRVIIRGHIDECAWFVEWDDPFDGVNGDPIDGRRLRVVDAKALGDSLWAKITGNGLDVFPMYQWQMSVYMHALGLAGALVCGWKSLVDGELRVRDELWIAKIDTPPFTIRDIKMRVAKLEAAVESGALGECDGSRYPCPFYFLHDAEGPAKEPPTRVDDEMLRFLVDRYNELYVEEKGTKAVFEAVEKKRKATGKEIIDWMTANGLEGGKAAVDEWTVNHLIVRQPEKFTKAYVQSYIQVRAGKGAESGKRKGKE